MPFFNLLIINQDNNFQKCGFPKTIFSKFILFQEPAQKKTAWNYCIFIPDGAQIVIFSSQW